MYSNELTNFDPSKKDYNSGLSLSSKRDIAFKVYLSKKTEKIAGALYLISNLFFEEEPLKWSIRQKGLKLLQQSLSFRITDLPESYLFSSLDGLLREIKALISLGQVSGLISEMNYSILAHEIETLFENLKVDQKETVKDISLGEAFFDVPKDDYVSDRKSRSQDSLKRQNSIRHSQLKTDGSMVIKKKTNRQELIISVLKKQPEANIKEFVQLIKDCSEKTIQRELGAMVESGVLKRQGERRWSRYSIK